GVIVAQSAWIDAAEGVVGEEERPSPIRPERELDALERPPVDEHSALRPALVVDLRWNGIARRRSRQNVGDQAFVPATDRVVEREAIVRTPVPSECDSAALCVPVPFRLRPQIGDAIANMLLVGRVST